MAFTFLNQFVAATHRNNGASWMTGMTVISNQLDAGHLGIVIIASDNITNTVTDTVDNTNDNIVTFQQVV